MITHSTTRVVVPSFSDVPNEGHQSIILLCLRMVDYITYNITYWLVVHPSEQYESVGMMKFPTEWKVIKFHGSKPPTSIIYIYMICDISEFKWNDISVQSCSAVLI